MLTAENNEHWIVQQAHRIPDHTAINSKQIMLSYTDLLRSSEKTASYLLAKGIKENDRICIISKHCSEFISVLNAIWLLGAVPIPISDKLKDHEFDEIIDHSSAKYLINLDPGLKIILRQNILFIDFTKALLSEEVNYNFQYNDFDPSKICLMLYTSGSSGKPKCVNFRFTDLYASAVLVDSYINHKLDDKWILSLPLNHIGGFSIIVRSLIAGCSIVIPKNLKHSELADSINQFQPSLLSLVPLMMKRLMKDYISPWSNLRHIFIGGGPVENNLIGKALSANWPVSVVYGSTETGSMVTVSSPDNLLKNGVSAGVPLEGVKVFIENSLDKKTDYGQVIIESPSVAHSYFCVESDQERTFSSGKFYSNDLGRIDENGNLQILGRSDDIIISGGINISLSQIENLINEKISSANCKALRIRSEKWGESYIIISEKTEGNTRSKILNILKEYAADYKHPYKIILVDTIPRNEMGKIKLNELKKLINFDVL